MRAQSAGVACRVCGSVAYSTRTAPVPTGLRQGWEWPRPRCAVQSTALSGSCSLQDLPFSGRPQTRTDHRGQRWKIRQSHRRHFRFRFCSVLYLNNDSSLIKELNVILVGFRLKYTCILYWKNMKYYKCKNIKVRIFSLNVVLWILFNFNRISEVINE